MNDTPAKSQTQADSEDAKRGTATHLIVFGEVKCKCISSKDIQVDGQANNAKN